MPLNKSWYSAEGLVTLLSMFIHCANPRSDAIRIRKGSVGPFYQMKLANIMLCFCFHMDSQGSVSLQWITSSTWNKFRLFILFHFGRPYPFLCFRSIMLINAPVSISESVGLLLSCAWTLGGFFILWFWVFMLYTYLSLSLLVSS